MESLQRVTDFEIDYSIFESFDREKIFQLNIMPLKKDSLFLQIATSKNDLSIVALKGLFSIPVKLIYVPHLELQFEWKHYTFKSKLFYLAKKALDNHDAQKSSPFTKELFDTILEYSVQNSASDIHLEVIDSSVVIRLRIDGELKQYFRFSIDLYFVLSSYIKYLGNLDISQRRLPLNARFSRKIKKENYDIRVSTMPTIVGESIVLRILDNQNTQKDLSTIGFCGDILHILLKKINLRQGLILITGPTGSGKTTTQYAILKELNHKNKKIITVEDPVEYKVDGVMQVNINEDIGLSYEKVLKNTLRQDPDILMIGEIRDLNSLKIAMQASLTGHLVIATLHTNGAIETITRLLDLGAEPYLIVATLQMVLSQRLLRLLCPHCKIKKESLYEAKGCKECNFTGYSGRQVLAEVLELEEQIHQLILQRETSARLNEILKAKFQSIEYYGNRLLGQGDTTLSEFHSKI